MGDHTGSTSAGFAGKVDAVASTGEAERAWAAIKDPRVSLFSLRSSRCGTSPLQYRNEVSFALRAPAMTVEVRTLFNRERHVMDIGFDVTGGLQGNRLRADDTQDCATHDHLLARDHPGNSSPLTDEDLGRLNITLDVAIDL